LIECEPVNGSDGIRYVNRVKVIAAIKSRGVNGCDGIRQTHCFQIMATIESSPFYVCYAFGDDQGSNSLAAAE